MARSLGSALRRVLPVLIAVAMVLIPAASAHGQDVRTGIAGMMPYYARLDANGIYRDDEWVAIVFYRPAEVVPVDFNLLDFYDWNLIGDTTTPLTVDGFIIWEVLGIQPLLINLHDLGAMPVWFVSWPQMRSAVSDGFLTISELAAMDSLKVGTATNYQEMLQPDHPGVYDGIIEFNARGMLNDGRSFRVHAVWNNVDNMRVSIEFK
jgi:hypothetical protein